MYGPRLLQVRRGLTDGESFGAAGLEYVGEDCDDWQQAAGNNDIDDVVERIAMKSESERDTREVFAAAVQNHPLGHSDVYSNSTVQYSFIGA